VVGNRNNNRVDGLAKTLVGIGVDPCLVRVVRRRSPRNRAADIPIKPKAWQQRGYQHLPRVVVGGSNQKAGIRKTVRRRLGIGNTGRIDAEITQIPPVQRLLYGDGAQRRLGKGLHRRHIGCFSRRDCQRARELAEINCVLRDVGLEPLAAKGARREFDIERECVDRLSQSCGALPNFFGKSGHLQWLRCRIRFAIYQHFE
jgi:hypothetical protein